jgi:hypothetical protein
MGGASSTQERTRQNKRADVETAWGRAFMRKTPEVFEREILCALPEMRAASVRILSDRSRRRSGVVGKARS